MFKKIFAFGFIFFTLLSCGKREEDASADLPGVLVMEAAINGSVIRGTTVSNIPLKDNVIRLTFSKPVDFSSVIPQYFVFTGGGLTLSKGEDDMSVLIHLPSPLQSVSKYTLVVLSGEQMGVNMIQPYKLTIMTGVSQDDVFPRISTDELLTKVQSQTFKYFWDYAHPVSGLTRERYGSGNTVTAGGSGFGIMALPVGVERGFITREEAAGHMRKILTFLSTKADRFHGAFPHWLNGETGAIIPFSEKDNGGDLVETALLFQGLLTAARYFDGADEGDIRSDIDALWWAVEWDWYTRNGQNALYWHWSPSLDWVMNMKISGWNEGLIAYVLAASSPTHSISKDVYKYGWANNGGFRNGRKFYDVTLPLGPDYGGPLFFSHYSFLGLDPRNLSDTYASYWDQNCAHSKINNLYCKANPGSKSGYSAVCWGLTASDYPQGYTASSPTNDTGTIAPTAALSSFPYTPEESLAALEYFYYKLGDRIFGEYGFRDAFNLGEAWFANSYIAIDQGPIILMIENYRSGLLWNCFMQHPDIQSGLEKLGFTW